MTDFEGIFPALLTPFDAHRSINRSALHTLIDMNIEKGVHGFYACGSTAEVFMMDTRTRKKLLEMITEHVNNRVCVIAHVGCISTRDAIDLARHAQANGAQAVSAVAPFYYRFTTAEIHRYYTSIADAVDVQMLLYNFPAFSGVTLSFEDFQTLLADPRFIGIKHTSSDYYLLERLRSAFPQKVLFNGFDEMFLSGLAAGADGAIGSTLNVMAEYFIAIRQCFISNQISSAQALQHHVNSMIQALAEVGAIPGLKAIINDMGIDFGQACEPFATPDRESTARLLKVWRQLPSPDAVIRLDK